MKAVILYRELENKQTLIYTASKPEMTAKSQRKLGSLRQNLEILKENKEQRSLS